MRYLFYLFSDDISRPRWQADLAGIGHWKSQLRALCREAAWLGRAPVFPCPAPLTAAHNFGVSVRSPFSRYLDTENIEVLYRPGGGARPAERLALSAISDVELRALDLPRNEILQLPPGTPASAEQNRRFRLIARRMAPGCMWMEQRAPLLKEAGTLAPAPVGDMAFPGETALLQVRFRSSAEIRGLAADIIRRLPREYCAVHVRRSDRMELPAIKIWTSPKGVAARLKQAGVAPGAPVYLMSDEPGRRWLRRMRRRRPFLHRTDFPRLNQLIRPPAPDNYFLFLAEQEILERAAKKIVLRPRSFDPWRNAGKYLLPTPLSAPQLRSLYHPAEINFSRALASFSQNLSRLAGPIAKAKRLARASAPMLRSLARYWALRLFAPQTLKRHRNRRRALGVPG